MAEDLFLLHPPFSSKEEFQGFIGPPLINGVKTGMPSCFYVTVLPPKGPSLPRCCENELSRRDSSCALPRTPWIFLRTIQNFPLLVLTIYTFRSPFTFPGYYFAPPSLFLWSQCFIGMMFLRISFSTHAFDSCPSPKTPLRVFSPFYSTFSAARSSPPASGPDTAPWGSNA